MAGRILVLDDEENYAEMLQELLRDNDYRVDTATRPERAIDRLEEIPYDLVISDYKMPVMDGADFLKKSRELYPNLPFILVSGLMNTPELVKVANMSVTLVMEKPLDTEAFLSHVARFSEPMTEEEKIALQKEIESDGADIEVSSANYPEEPRFFSAVSISSKRFMQKAWAIANEGNKLYILEPIGGDAELAAKDVSQWRGNGDLPVSSFELPISNEEAIGKLREILAEPMQSTTICVRLTSISQLAQAAQLTDLATTELEDAANLLLVFILGTSEAGAFLEQAGDHAVVLPELADRPSDVAYYARRFARIASERSGKKNCSEFTPEAAYLILSHDWAGGYKQVQKVVTEAVASIEVDEAIPVEILDQVLGLGESPIVAPEGRLAALMDLAQKRYFEKEMNSAGLTAAELAEKLEFGVGIQTRDDLQSMSLVKADLAKL